MIKLCLAHSHGLRNREASLGITGVGTNLTIIAQTQHLSSRFLPLCCAPSCFQRHCRRLQSIIVEPNRVIRSNQSRFRLPATAAVALLSAVSVIAMSDY